MQRAIFLILILFGSSPAWSMQTDAPAPSAENNGSITLGYRFADVAGRKPNFDQIFGLRSGLRLEDLSFSGRAGEGGHRLYDFYSLSADGIGGEPFAGGSLRLHKANAYDLRANYRQSYFYWNSDDAGPLPAGPGLTANHDFATVRKAGTISLDIRATKNFHVNLEFGRNTRSGTNFTTRVVDYFDSSSTWGSFARANAYYVSAPVDETGNRFSGGLSYHLRGWDLFYRTGYQSYSENVRMANAVSPERSINTADPTTAAELLTSGSWVESRKLRTPISEFSYTGRPMPKLTLRGGYIYYRYTGPATFNGVFAGIARTNSGGTTDAPYTATETDSMNLREPNHIVDEGLSYAMRDWWNIHVDYRYSRFTVNGTGTLQSTSSLTGANSGSTDHEWRYGLHVADAAFEFFPSSKVVFRPGIRLMKRDVVDIEDGVANQLATKRSKIVSPIVSLSYSPSQKLSLRGDFQTRNNGSPYTRITPRTDIISRFVGRYQATDKLSIEDNFNIRNSKYATTDFRNSLRTNGAVVSYQLSDRYAVFSGMTYDSLLATASVTFLRGPAPLNTTWRDQTINRVWQAGIDAHPLSRLQLRLSGNYLRTTGVGEISGEAPVYGPIRWPMVTGTVAWRVPRVGILSMDLQRTYFIQDIFTSDNFSGNILGFRWTKEF